MERDVRYIIVGITVSVVISMFVLFLIWQAQTYRTTGGEQYAVMVNGPVSGLADGNPVRYLGVRIGRVDRVDLVSTDHVEVIINITARTPINSSTVARIEPQGITGNSYMALITEDATAPPAPVSDRTRLPVIRAEPSRLDRLFAQTPELIDKLNSLTEGLESLLTEQNRDNLADILEGMAAFSTRLDDLAGKLAAAADDVAGMSRQGGDTLESVESTSDRTRETLSQARQAIGRFDEAFARVGDLAGRVDRLVVDSSDSVGRFTNSTLPEMDELVRRMQAATVQFEQLARTLSEEPSRLLYRRESGGVEVPP